MEEHLENFKSLEDRFWEKVDKSGECWEFDGAHDAYGYAIYSTRSKRWLAHRFAVTSASGPITEGMFIDHICHNKGCVNPKHLREATMKQNMENRSGAQSNSKTGVRGVYFRPDCGKYQATVRHANKTIHVGYFETIAEADEAVTAKRLELFTYNDLDRQVAA